MLANIHRSKKQARAYRPADFMPRWSRPDPQTPEQMLAMVRALASKGVGKLTSRKAAGHGESR